jgi:hypothetical protein
MVVVFYFCLMNLCRMPNTAPQRDGMESMEKTPKPSHRLRPLQGGSSPNAPYLLRSNFAGTTDTQGSPQAARLMQSSGSQTQVKTQEPAMPSHPVTQENRRQGMLNLHLRLKEQQRLTHQRREVARLQQRRDEPSQADPLRIQALWAADTQSRLEGLEGLVALQPYAALTYETLRNILEDAEQPTQLRVKALQLLAQYPSSLEDDALIERMVACVWDKELDVRKAATQTLRVHPDPRALGPLVGLLGTRDPELRRMADIAIHDITKKLGPPPPLTGGDV